MNFRRADAIDRYNSAVLLPINRAGRSNESQVQLINSKTRCRLFSFFSQMETWFFVRLHCILESYGKCIRSLISTSGRNRIHILFISFLSNFIHFIHISSLKNQLTISIIEKFLKLRQTKLHEKLQNQQNCTNTLYIYLRKVT